MAEINLLDFFKTGQFGPVQIGMTCTDVEALLGPPDNYTTDLVWEYGGIELHFASPISASPPCYRLTQITFSPIYLANPEMWQTDIAPWVFGSYFGPTQQELKEALLQASISYKDYRRPENRRGANGRHPKANWLYDASHEISGILYLPSGVSATYSQDDLILNVQLSQNGNSNSIYQ